MTASFPVTQGQEMVQISPEKVQAVLLTWMASLLRLHLYIFQAWKSTFDAFLKSREGDKFQEFTEQDYLDLSMASLEKTACIVSSNPETSLSMETAIRMNKALPRQKTQNSCVWFIRKASQLMIRLLRSFIN